MSQMHREGLDPEKLQRLRDFLARQHAEVPSSHSTGPVLKAVLDEAGASVAAALEAAGVDALILKGPALEAALYQEGEARQYVDVDLLVSPDDIQLAEHVLETLGYRNAGAHLGIDDVGGLVHAETWILLGSSALTPQIELHRWFPGAAAPATEVWSALWNERTRLVIARQQVWVLNTGGQALQLATHLAQHGPRYSRGAWELRLALERWPPEVWQQAAELARRIGAIEFFAAGMRLAAPPAALIEELQLPSAAGTLWDVEHREEFPRGVQFIEAAHQARGAARLGVLRRALLPKPGWIIHNYGLYEPSRARLTLAYVQHVLRAPWWGARAVLFARRRRQAARG
jgi:hypothetical protein